MNTHSQLTRVTCSTIYTLVWNCIALAQPAPSTLSATSAAIAEAPTTAAAITNASMNWIARPLTASFLFAPILFCLLLLLFFLLFIFRIYRVIPSAPAACSFSSSFELAAENFLLNVSTSDYIVHIALYEHEDADARSMWRKRALVWVCVPFRLVECNGAKLLWNALAMPPVHSISVAAAATYFFSEIINIWAVIGYAKIWLWPKVEW